ncbi:MAG: OmpA family protein [Pseudomonadota bacterium]
MSRPWRAWRAAHVAAAPLALALLLPPALALAQAASAAEEPETLQTCKLYETADGVTELLHPKSFADEAECAGCKPVTGKEKNRPEFATGPPDKKSFSMGSGGGLIVRFTDNALVNGPGEDLIIFEIGRAQEPTDVSVRIEGDRNWIPAGTAGGGRRSLNLPGAVGPDEVVREVRLRDRNSPHSPPEGADIDAVAAIGFSWVETLDAGRTLFDFGDASLTDTARARLDAIAEQFDYADVDVLIFGHADRRGTETYNQDLSEQRAAAVERYLADRLRALGKAPTSMRSRGLGERALTGQGHRLDRRVEVFLTPTVCAG